MRRAGTSGVWAGDSRRRAWAVASVAGAVVATAFVGCSGGDEKVTSCEGQTLKASHGSAPTLQFAAFYIAEQEGYFDDAGVGLKITSLGNTDAAQALIGGSVDVVAGGFNVVLEATNRGGPIVSFATTSNRATADIGIRSEDAPPDGANLRTSLSALKGLRIGVTSPGSNSDQLLRYLLIDAGLDPDRDVEIIGTGGATEMVAAFAQKSIDAYVIGPPNSDVAAEQGDGTVMLRLSSGVAPLLDDATNAVATTSQRVLDNKSALVGCYATALDRAVKLIHEHPDQAAAVLRDDFESLTDEQWKVAWQGVVDATPASAQMVPEQAEKAAGIIGDATGEELDASGAFTDELLR